MILGMSTSAFTTLHVVLSLIGIAAGFVVLAGMFVSKRFDGWTAVFLATTILTSVTGYFFPVDKVLPSHIVGALSLIALALAVLGFYRYRLEGSWRWIYVVTAIVALWFNVFVAVAQSFAKIAFLHSLAPTQSEAPFVISQLVVLVAFVALGIGAVRSFHPVSSAPSLRPV
ncbi:MAG TPA: hypothetical protein VMU79_11565 [Casimicrobiaceae bacterium]|jgi:hypothetical protein|nr:hypothetical protein [Casimicrobiaceae bacterium]